MTRPASPPFWPSTHTSPTFVWLCSCSARLRGILQQQGPPGHSRPRPQHPPRNPTTPPRRPPRGEGGLRRDHMLRLLLGGIPPKASRGTPLRPSRDPLLSTPLVSRRPLQSPLEGAFSKPSSSSSLDASVEKSKGASKGIDWAWIFCAGQWGPNLWDQAVLGFPTVSCLGDRGPARKVHRRGIGWLVYRMASVGKLSSSHPY